MSIITSPITEILDDWGDTRLKDVTRAIGIFVQYLLVPRAGFIERKEITITLPVVKYIIEEIYNCRLPLSNSPVLVSEIFRARCKRLIQEVLDTPNVSISADVIEFIWRYIKLGLDTLIEGVDVEKEVKRVKAVTKRRFLQEGVSVDDYQELLSKLERATEDAQESLDNYNSDPLYRSYGFVKVSMEEIDMLESLGVPRKQAKRIQQIKELEDKINRDFDSEVITEENYNAYMKELNQEGLRYLNRVLKQVDKKMIFNNTLKGNTDTDKAFGSYPRKYDNFREIKQKINTLITRLNALSRDVFISIDMVNEETRNDPQFIDPKYLELIHVSFQPEEVDLLSDLGVSSRLLEIIQDQNKAEADLQSEFRNGVINSLSYRERIVTLLENKKETLKMILRGVIDYNLSNFDKRLQAIEQQDITREVQERFASLIKARIDAYRAKISTRKCAGDYERDIENCFVKSLLYLSVTVADWLGIEEIGLNELMCALRIMLPDELEQYIQIEEEELDLPAVLGFKKRLRELDFRVADKGKFIATMVRTFSNLDVIDITTDEYMRFNNRTRYFANDL